MEFLTRLGNVRLDAIVGRELVIYVTKRRDGEFVGVTPGSFDSRNRPEHSYLSFPDFGGEDIEGLDYTVHLHFANGRLSSIDVFDKEGNTFGAYANYQQVVDVFTGFCLGDVPSRDRLAPVLQEHGFLNEDQVLY